MEIITAHSKLVTFGIGIAITFAIGTAIGMLNHVSGVFLENLIIMISTVKVTNDNIHIHFLFYHKFLNTSKITP
jgi:hypothetical protein